MAHRSSKSAEKSLVLLEETLTEKQLQCRLRELRYCEIEVSAYRDDPTAHSRKRAGVKSLLGYFFLRRMITVAILLMRVKARIAKMSPEDFAAMIVTHNYSIQSEFEFLDVQYYNFRDYTPNELIERVKRWRREIDDDKAHYEYLLALFGIDSLDKISLRHSHKTVAKPITFKSPWRQLLSLAIDHLPVDSGYKAIANWISDNHPYAVLPHYCYPHTKKSADKPDNKSDQKEAMRTDLGWLAANNKSVADGLTRDIWSVRDIKGRPPIAFLCRQCDRAACAL